MDIPTPLTEEAIKDMKATVDTMSYEGLLRRNRFEKIGSPWFGPEVGPYLIARMNELRQTISDAEFTQISKKIGW